MLFRSTKSHLKNLRRTKWKLWILSFRRPLKNLTLSTSISQLPDIYKPDEFGYNYIFLNPIFNPLTGKLQNGFYEQGLKAANEKSGKQLIARGGVNISSIEKIQHLGFHGFALNSSIWSNEDPVNYFLKITDECQRLGIKINP